MNKKQIDKYRKAAEDGSIPDDENPLYLFSLTASALLAKGLQGEFSFTWLAKMTLASRGLNMRGEWVGFDKAEQLRSGRKKSKSKKL